ncbi:MAG: anaerobic ribonucleoside-triphosphate reductase activating protein [Methanosphaera sp.]|nr:anaerobic ribonucleoside-triphosphate reductase activating protein [Methanosphaera sp.]
MNIQPTYSSLDYPGKMALVLFTPGCDLRCRYCHNPQLLKSEKLTRMDVDLILDELDDNIDFIDGIVLSGGEPLLKVDVINEFIIKAKDNNLLIKLDTNGLHPDKLVEVVDDLDYVAMDIKAPLDEYYKISPVYPDNTREIINKTMDIILNHDVFLECRTTYVPGLLEPGDIEKIIRMIRCDQYTLQQFRNRVTLDAGLSTYEEPNPEMLRDILEGIDTDIPSIHLKSGQFGNQTIKNG